MASSEECYFPAFRGSPKPHISYGLPFHEICAHRATCTFKASRVYVVVSRSISKTDAWRELQDVLGAKLAGVRYGIEQHTPWPDVLALTADMRAARPDLVITLGGGSITDGVKLARLFLANDVADMEGVLRIGKQCELSLGQQAGESFKSEGPRPASVPCINVPTTLSAGEFTPAGGGTDPATRHKLIMMHPSMQSDLVVLDPDLTLSTPPRFWLSTGVRGVDHCCEGLYGNLPAATPARDAELLAALRQLLPSLLITKRDWADRPARLREALGVRALGTAIRSGMGASHGIGHQLGPLGVGHGETSCVVLPWVLKWNWRRGDAALRARLEMVAEVFWTEPAVAEMLGKAGLERGTADLGDCVAAFVAALGLPSTLGHFGIGEDVYGGIAENALTDRCTLLNPVELSREDVVEILRMAA